MPDHRLRVWMIDRWNWSMYDHRPVAVNSFVAYRCGWKCCANAEGEESRKSVLGEVSMEGGGIGGGGWTVVGWRTYLTKRCHRLDVGSIISTLTAIFDARSNGLTRDGCGGTDDAGPDDGWPSSAQQKRATKRYEYWMRSIWCTADNGLLTFFTWWWCGRQTCVGRWPWKCTMIGRMIDRIQ